MNFEIVKKQVIKACKNIEITDTEEIRVFVEFFKWYYTRYFKLFGEEHKRLTTQSITTAIENMWGFDEIMGADNPLGVLQDLAKKYFNCDFFFETDYSIMHFSCPEILQNRIYELFL